MNTHAPLRRLLDTATEQLDQSATHDGLTNCDTLAAARGYLDRLKPDYCTEPDAYPIHTPAHDGGPFNLRPANRWTVPADKILCNDVQIDLDERRNTHPHGVRLWLITDEHGPAAAVWASCTQDALDEAADADLLDHLQLKEEDIEEDDEPARLGNADEPFNLDHVWAYPVTLDPPRDHYLILAFARAMETGPDTLAEL